MLPSVSYGKHQPENWQNETTPEISVPHTPNKEGEDLPIVSAPYVPQERRSRPSLLRRPLLAALAVVISIATFAVVISICNDWRRRKRVPAFTPRKLSGNDVDDEYDDVTFIEDCLNLEADLGILQQRATSQHDGGQNVGVEGLVAALQAATAEHEATLGMLAPQKETAASHSVPGRDATLGMLAPWEEGPASHSVPGHDETLGMLAPWEEAPASHSVPGHDATLGMLATWGDSPSSHSVPVQIQQSAHEDLTHSGSASQSYDEEMISTYTISSIAYAADGNSLEGAQALDADAWLEHTTTTTSNQGEQEKPNSPPSAVSKSGVVQPSTSGLATLLRRGEGAARPQGIYNHPYVRLPSVGKDVSIRNLEVDCLFGAYRKSVPFSYFLFKVRSVLLQRVLGQSDVNLLVTSVEGLIGSAWYFAKRKIRRSRPVYAAESLGCQFLALDAIVSVIHVLGEPMDVDSWWDRFIVPFDYDISSPYPYPAGGISTPYNRKLAHRLSKALKLYKQMKRPALEEIVKLKEMLFLSPDAPSYFRSRMWDPWREDATGV